MNKEEAFEYLERLRESAVTNMYGAAPYLQARFGASRQEAKEMLLAWMEHKEKEARE
jgi:hypothetical protein